MVLQIVMMLTALATGALAAPPAPECAFNHMPAQGALILTAALAALHGRCHGGVQRKGAIRVLALHTFLYWATVQTELQGKCHHDGKIVAVLPAGIVNCLVYFAIARVCTPKLTNDATGCLTHGAMARKMNEDCQNYTDYVVGGAFAAVLACICIAVVEM